MAISTVVAVIDGTTYNLTLNSSTGNYEATVTAPGQTSYNQTGGYYDVKITATNDAGTSATASAATNSGLKLVVRETVAPVISIVSPGAGAYVTNATPTVMFRLEDETGGSGINLNSLVVKLDGTAVPASEIDAGTMGIGSYLVTYTPASALSDGAHTLVIDVSDNDGNAAVQKTRTFTVDTIPPVLSVTSPAEDTITTAATSYTIAGVTNDATSSPVTLTVGDLVNSNPTAVPVGSDGSWSTVVTLKEGTNYFTITAADAAGQETRVYRTIKLDTSVPKITAASVTPNPVDAGATMVISVTVT